MPLPWILIFNETTFDNVVTAVQANSERRQRTGNTYFPNPTTFPKSFISSKESYQGNHRFSQFHNRGRGGSGGRGRNRGRGRGGRPYGDKRMCHYCGKPGNFIKFCRFRIANEGNVANLKNRHHHGNSTPNSFQKHRYTYRNQQ